MRAIAVFIAIAFGFSWAIAFWMQSQGGFEGVGIWAGLYLIVFMFGPALAALICGFTFDRGRTLSALGFKPGRTIPVLVWSAWGWILPVILVALSSLLILALTRSAPADAAARLAEAVEATGESLPMPAQTLLIIQLAVGIPIGILTNTAILIISEELGWRGWLQPRLAPLGFWPAALVSGVIWGVWHAPIILMGYNYPGMGWAGVAAMTGFTILLTPYLALLRERGGGVYAAGAFHGSLNAVAGVGLLFLPDPSFPWNGLLGLAGFGLLAAGWPLIALYRHMKKPA
ncbi:CPBP family intramembrane glutamic endopeptidase [Maricaulis parjimensis]|uniref:CPBP family intramembrane glutamic endopeptidase n=1 Tax=Maricaulis parjimensis TaxID=144023 RepID=UPI00193A945D|nr:CPBP family intramembrane glutamic endopeptidase [Maricaulis parjimensis]